VNTIIFGALAIISLFIFFNLGKVKASRKQLDRPNRINRFGNQQPNNIIEGDAEEINESDEEKKIIKILFCLH
jgi:cell shape-determining protein MreC